MLVQKKEYNMEKRQFKSHEHSSCLCDVFFCIFSPLLIAKAVRSSFSLDD
jgi:hypothetical protein